MLARHFFNRPTMGNWHPFLGMERMARQMDWMTDAMFGRPGARLGMPRVFPAINIAEDKEKYYVHAELPGMTADDIKLEVNGNKLSLSGERKIQFEGENAKYHRRERDAGKFSRVIGLPGDVAADEVSARLENGLLTVAIAKAATAKPRQITVNAN